MPADAGIFLQAALIKSIGTVTHGHMGAIMAQWGNLVCSGTLVLAKARATAHAALAVAVSSAASSTVSSAASSTVSAGISAGLFAGVFSAMTACAALSDQPSDNALIGAWARSPAGCERPELTFRRDRLDIAVDADGAPANFSYAGIRYRSGDGRVAVELGSSHPYGKTADRHVLEFRLDRQGVLALVRTPAADTIFIRCSN